MLTPDQRKVPTLQDHAAAWRWVALEAAWVHKIFVKIVNEKVIKQFPIGYRGRPFLPGFRWTYPKGAQVYGQDVGDFLDYLLSEALEAAAVGFDRFDSDVPTVLDGTQDEKLRRFVAKIIQHAVTDEAQRVAKSNGLSSDIVRLTEAEHEPVPEEDDSLTWVERAAQVMFAMDSLSDVEKRALEAWAQGTTYSDIAVQLGLVDRSHAVKVVRRAKSKAAKKLLGEAV